MIVVDLKCPLYGVRLKSSPKCKSICVSCFHFPIVGFTYVWYFLGHLRQSSSCDVAACYYGLGMATLALAIPLLPCLLGISALFVRYAVISCPLPLDFHLHAFAERVTV